MDAKPYNFCIIKKKIKTRKKKNLEVRREVKSIGRKYTSMQFQSLSNLPLYKCLQQDHS